MLLHFRAALPLMQLACFTLAENLTHRYSALGCIRTTVKIKLRLQCFAGESTEHFRQQLAESCI